MQHLGIVSLTCVLLSSVFPALVASDPAILDTTLPMADVVTTRSSPESFTAAAPSSFHALRHLSPGQPVPLTDTQLASIHGRACFICLRVNIGVNIGVIIPINISILSRGISQSNRVSLRQFIFFR